MVMENTDPLIVIFSINWATKVIFIIELDLFEQKLLSISIPDELTIISLLE